MHLYAFVLQMPIFHIIFAVAALLRAWMAAEEQLTPPPPPRVGDGWGRVRVICFFSILNLKMLRFCYFVYLFIGNQRNFIVELICSIFMCVFCRPPADRITGRVPVEHGMNKFPRAPCKYTFKYCEYIINTLIEIIILSISSDFLIIIFRIIFINILL